MFNLFKIILFRGLIFCTILFYCNAFAETYDPTRPLIGNKKSIKKASRARPDALKLTSVLYASGRSVAVINNQVLKIGDKIEKSTLIAIARSSVRMKKGKLVYNLRLESDSIKKKNQNIKYRISGGVR